MVAKSRLSRNRTSLLRWFRPVISPVDLIRLGGNGDGAYLVPDDLEGITHCLSPGVANITTFETELAERFNIPSDLIDGSIDGSQLKLNAKMHRFRPLYLGKATADGTISLDDWCKEFDGEDDLLLQMDIEGAEYESLMAASEKTLGRFRVIVVELHQLDGRDGDFFSTHMWPALTKLMRTHSVVHASPNNCCGESIDKVTGMNIPRVLELTLLRNDRFTGPRHLRSREPHPLEPSVNAPSKPPVMLNDAWYSVDAPSTESYAERYTQLCASFWECAGWPVSVGRQPWPLIMPTALVDGPLPDRDLDTDFVGVGRSFDLDLSHVDVRSHVTVQCVVNGFDAIVSVHTTRATKRGFFSSSSSQSVCEATLLTKSEDRRDLKTLNFTFDPQEHGPKLRFTVQSPGFSVNPHEEPFLGIPERPRRLILTEVTVTPEPQSRVGHDGDHIHSHSHGDENHAG